VGTSVHEEAPAVQIHVEPLQKVAAAAASGRFALQLTHPARVTVTLPSGRPDWSTFAESGDWNIWRVETTAPGIPATSPPAVATASAHGDVLGALSPDGRRVAFVSNRSGDQEIWVADPDGAQCSPAHLDGRRHGAAMLTASSDGRTILFTRIDASIDSLMLALNFR
jgi:hypothetical protein